MNNIPLTLDFDLFWLKELTLFGSSIDASILREGDYVSIRKEDFASLIIREELVGYDFLDVDKFKEFVLEKIPTEYEIKRIIHDFKGNEQNVRLVLNSLDIASLIASYKLHFV